MLPRWTRPDGDTPDETVTCLASPCPRPECLMASSAARVTQSVGVDMGGDATGALADARGEFRRRASSVMHDERSESCERSEEEGRRSQRGDSERSEQMT